MSRGADQSSRLRAVSDALSALVTEALSGVAPVTTLDHSAQLSEGEHHTRDGEGLPRRAVSNLNASNGELLHNCLPGHRAGGSGYKENITPAVPSCQPLVV